MYPSFQLYYLKHVMPIIKKDMVVYLREEKEKKKES